MAGKAAKVQTSCLHCNSSAHNAALPITIVASILM